MKTPLHKTIFSFFGPPGSGKGTLAAEVVEELGFNFLSTGNLCRKHVSEGTELGKQFDNYLKQGSLIPDELVTAMVAEWLREATKEGSPVILDGFPRTQGQSTGLLSFIKTELSEYSFRVFYITLNDEEIVRRLSSRRVCSDKECQAVYAGDFDTDVCSKCSSSLIKRDDDDEEVIRTRLRSYPAYRDSLLAFYKDAGIVIEKLDVTDMTKEQTFRTFKSML